MKRWPKDTVAAGRRHTVGLKSDGTVIAVGDNKLGQCDVNEWTDIVAVAAGNVHMATNTGNVHTVGLKADGTVLAVGWNTYDQCNVNSWDDIVAIAAGWRHSVGLKSDGTVVAVGRKNEGECNVNAWHDIVRFLQVTGIQSALKMTEPYWLQEIIVIANAMLTTGMIS